MVNVVWRNVCAWWDERAKYCMASDDQIFKIRTKVISEIDENNVCDDKYTCTRSILHYEFQRWWQVYTHMINCIWILIHGSQHTEVHTKWIVTRIWLCLFWILNLCSTKYARRNSTYRSDWYEHGINSYTFLGSWQSAPHWIITPYWHISTTVHLNVHVIVSLCPWY